MTDADVIALLQSPNELTGDQVNALRDKLIRSANLRSQLSHANEVHGTLEQILGRIGETPESIEHLAQQFELRRARLRRRRALWTLCSIVAAVILVVSAVRFANHRSATNDREMGNQADSADSSKEFHETVSKIDATNAEGRSSTANVQPASDGNQTVRSKQPEQIAAPARIKPQPAPWDQSLETAPVPFELAWSRDLDQGNSAPSIAELQEWFDPVSGHDGRFFLDESGAQQLAGFEGTLQLRAPMDRGAALRLSIPEHQDMRIFLYHGAEGLMIQHNDANDRANTKMRRLENDLVAAKADVEKANHEYKIKADAVRRPLRAIQAAIKGTEIIRTALKEAERKIPKVIAAAKQAEAEYRKSTATKNNAFREAPKIVARSRDAARQLQRAQTAANKQPDDKQLARALKSAKKVAQKEADAAKKAARSKSDANRAWSLANSRKRSADQSRRKTEQDIRRAKLRISRAEWRVKQQRTRSQQFIDAHDNAKRVVEKAQGNVERLMQQWNDSKRAAADEAENVSPNSNAWAAFSTKRGKDKVIPDWQRLVATDGGRTHSTELRNSSQLELHYRDGQIVLTRGDIVLLTAPMDAPPSEVYVSGRLLIDRIGMHRTTNVAKPHEILTDAVNAISLETWDWTIGPAKHCRVQALANGGVEFAAEEPLGEAVAWTSFSDCKSEFVLLDVQATPGTGITLESDSGKHIGTLEYFRDKSTDSLAIRWAATNDRMSKPKAESESQRIVCYVADRHWVRLLIGCGTIKGWTSSDQKNWAPIRPFVAGVPGRVARIGLRYDSRKELARIALLGVQQERFHQLASIAGNTELVTVTYGVGLDPMGWRQHVLKQRPIDVTSRDWIRSCAVRAITSGCEADLAEHLFDVLLEDPAILEKSSLEKYDLVCEFALLSDLRSDQARLNRMVERFVRIAEHAASQNESQPYSTLRRVLMSAPLWTQHRIVVVRPSLVKHELLDLVYRDQWREVLRLCRELQFFQIQHDHPLIVWAKAAASESLPALSTNGPPSIRPVKWHQPLIHHIDKELYNQLTDFCAAISSQAYADAVLIASSSDPSKLTGVVPSESDPRLLISFPAALENARRDDSKFNARIEADFLSRGLLQVRRSMAEKNVPAVESAMLRYPSTLAAVEAHSWLGDRALSAGQFQVALDHFRSVRAVTADDDDDKYASKMALAAAMLGADLHEPVPDVRLNGSAVAAADFKNLLREMCEQHGTRRGLIFGQPRNDPDGKRNGIVPTDFEIRIHGQIDDVTHIDSGVDTDELQIDWAARRIATTVDGERLIVNSGSRITAFDLRSGGDVWTSEPIRASTRWTETLVAMRPIVVGNFIFARQLDSRGPCLVCLDKKNGERVWRRLSVPSEVLVSDPMIDKGGLYVLAAVRVDQLDVMLRIVSFDPSTGRRMESHDLVRLRESWWQRKLCRVSSQDGMFIASVGGVIVCADFTGHVRWMRTQTVLPQDVDHTWVTQQFDPPLTFERNLYIAQPGVRVVECLDRIGGALRWRVVIPGIRRLVGLCHERLVIVTDDGIMALDGESGATVWRHNCATILNGVFCGHDGRVIYCRRKQSRDSDGQFVPEIVWLEATTGREKKRVTLDSLKDQQPWLGGFFVANRRAWTFSGRNRRDSRPRLIEFVTKTQ